MKNLIKCTGCKKPVNSPKELELSMTDGNYYTSIPNKHVSQGIFYFCNDCAINELQKTLESYEDKKQSHYKIVPIFDKFKTVEIYRDNVFIINKSIEIDGCFIDKFLENKNLAVKRFLEHGLTIIINP